MFLYRVYAKAALTSKYGISLLISHFCSNAVHKCICVCYDVFNIGNCFRHLTKVSGHCVVYTLTEVGAVAVRLDAVRCAKYRLEGR